MCWQFNYHTDKSLLLRMETLKKRLPPAEASTCLLHCQFICPTNGMSGYKSCLEMCFIRFQCILYSLGCFLYSPLQSFLSCSILQFTLCSRIPQSFVCFVLHIKNTQLVKRTLLILLSFHPCLIKGKVCCAIS